MSSIHKPRFGLDRKFFELEFRGSVVSAKSYRNTIQTSKLCSICSSISDVGASKIGCI